MFNTGALVHIALAHIRSSPQVGGDEPPAERSESVRSDATTGAHEDGSTRPCLVTGTTKPGIPDPTKAAVVAQLLAMPLLDDVEAGV